nr:universal stress protein [uncultured Holophaga sp.]
MFNRILVGIDFSESSKVALTQAQDLAGRLSLPLTVAHILQPPAPMLPEAQIGLPDKAWMDAIEAHALEQLNLWVKDIPGAAVLVKWGSPADELVRAAGSGCLIVVGRVGHSALQRMLFGSTAVKVIKHSPCNVLVVQEPS